MIEPFRKIGLTFMLGFYLTPLLGQESIVSSGNSVSSSSGSISYSIGQVACITNTGSNGSLAQGVQQPYEIFVIVGIHEITIDLEVTAYPNPTNELLTLKYANYTNENASYQIYNVEGKLLETNSVSGSQTLINMGKMVTGNYFIKVTLENRELKVFKIIKQ